MVSRAYGRLESRGLVERVIVGDGERITHLEVTKQGFKVARELQALQNKDYRNARVVQVGSVGLWHERRTQKSMSQSRGCAARSGMTEELVAMDVSGTALQTASDGTLNSV